MQHELTFLWFYTNSNKRDYWYLKKKENNNFYLPFFEIDVFRRG